MLFALAFHPLQRQAAQRAGVGVAGGMAELGGGCDGGFENASPDGAICMAVIYTVRGVYETYWHRMAREWDAKNRPTTLLILQRDISYA